MSGGTHGGSGLGNFQRAVVDLLRLRVDACCTTYGDCHAQVHTPRKMERRPASHDPLSSVRNGTSKFPLEVQDLDAGYTCELCTASTEFSFTSRHFCLKLNR